MSMDNDRKLPFRIDTEALALGYYFVIDFNYKPVREFETMEDAEVFIAEANQTDIETVRKDAKTQAKMLQEYRHNLKSDLKKRESQIPSPNHSGGWSWETLPEEVRRRFPPPPERSRFSSNDDYEEARGYWKARVGRNISIALHTHKQPKATARKLDLIPFAKTILIWVAFFALIVAGVYVIVYLDEIGAKDNLVKIATVGMAWGLVIWIAFEYYKNRVGKKLPLFNPSESIFEKTASIVVLLVLFAPVFFIVIASIVWLFS